jgi:hypothetical protein
MIVDEPFAVNRVFHCSDTTFPPHGLYETRFRMNRRTFITSFTLLIALISLVVYTVPSSDTLSDLNCHLPCWGGITPGRTTQAQALEIVENRYGTTNVSISKAHVGRSGWIDWQEGDLPDGLNGTLDYWAGNILAQHVHLNVNSYLTVHQLIQQYGNPTSVRFEGLWEGKCIARFLVFPQIAAVVGLRSGEASIRSNGVFPGHHISGFSLYPISEGVKPNYIDFELPWHGYGEYCPQTE